MKFGNDIWAIMDRFSFNNPVRTLSTGIGVGLSDSLVLAVAVH